MGTMRRPKRPAVKPKAAGRQADELPRWSVYRLRKPPLQFIGFVRAQDASGAITTALDQYPVPENWRDRLIALPEP